MAVKEVGAGAAVKKGVVTLLHQHLACAGEREGGIRQRSWMAVKEVGAGKKRVVTLLHQHLACGWGKGRGRGAVGGRG